MRPLAVLSTRVVVYATTSLVVIAWLASALIHSSAIANFPNSHFAIYNDHVGVNFSYGFCNSLRANRPYLDIDFAPAQADSSWHEAYNTSHFDEDPYTHAWTYGHPSAVIIKKEDDIYDLKSRNVVYSRGRVGLPYFSLTLILLTFCYFVRRRVETPVISSQPPTLDTQTKAV